MTKPPGFGSGLFLMFCSLQKLEHFLEHFLERRSATMGNELTIKRAYVEENQVYLNVSH